MSDNAGGIVIDSLCGNCPVQAEGTIDGEPFYFRARGESWSIEIGPGNTAAVVDALESGGDEARAQVESQPVWTYREPYGEWPAAGWMSEDEARAFIAQGANLWRNREPIGAPTTPTETR